MQEPVIDTRRLHAMGMLLNRLNNITRQIRTVETIPFDIPLIIDFTYKFTGFDPRTERVIASVHEIHDLQLVLHLFASNDNISYLDINIKNKNIYSLNVLIDWVQNWEPLKRDELPLTLDYKIKYPAYNLLFQ